MNLGEYYISDQITLQSVQKVEIDAARAGQRLDNFLFARFRRLPKSRIYKMLRKGEVRVNGGRSKQGYRIQSGDVVRLPPVRLDCRPSEGPTTAPAAQLDKLARSMVHEDENFLVIAKPSGLAVHAGSGLRFGVIEMLRQIRPDAPFLELVHRLDRDTSGCLLIAKNRLALTTVNEIFKTGEMTKYYQALVAGRWQGGKRRIDQALTRQGAHRKVRHTVADTQGKRAVSEFTPLDRFGDATLMNIRIFTGRTHQIRVHAAELGYPLLGDKKYGNFELNRWWEKNKGLKRLFLHAAELSFEWPPSGQILRFSAPLPPELQQVIEQCHE